MLEIYYEPIFFVSNTKYYLCRLKTIYWINMAYKEQLEGTVNEPQLDMWGKVEQQILVKKERKKTRFADLFAGCGGLSLGLEQAGFECVFVNEINATFAATHRYNHQLAEEQYFVGDINNLLGVIDNYKHYITDLDLVCGGPPCQGFSMANRQKVIDDPRNQLYKSFLLFLAHTRPKFFVMENVKGMVNKIEEISNDFEKYLGKEYDVSYCLVNAKDFGIPQNRERLFVIGNRIGYDSKEIVDNIINEQVAKNFILKDALKGLVPLQPKSVKNNNQVENDEIGYTVRNYQYEKDDYYNYINGNKKIDILLNHKNRYNNERDIEIFRRLPQGANSLHPSIADIMPYSSRNHIFKDKYYKLDENAVCKTITSHMKFDCNMYIHPWEARGLSPREAARIQTFPDDFFFQGSQNSWYAQIGNAVPVKLAEVIGKHIIEKL